MSTNRSGTGSVSADAHAREMLELPTVLQRAARLASFSAGQAEVLALRPAADRATVRARLELTAQGRQFLEISPSFTVGGARDVRDRAERAALGARLDPADLLDVHDHLRATRLAVAAVGRQAAELPALWSLVEAVGEPLKLEGRIAAAIDEQAEVRDEASRELAQLRRALEQARGRLARLLERLVRHVPAEVLRERLVTERRGRLTVPVRRDRQRDFPGVVHDVSASGVTVFMEPLAAIEAGNEIRALDVAERREVERILVELSAAVGAERKALDAAVQALANLDRTLASARYAMSLDATPPEVSDDTGFDLQAARHPLLERPVPIDVHLDGLAARALVITGANTGGKTVALKTVGLLHLMAACGLHVPAKAGSRIAVFERVVADIGDAQSIEHSLSTFASHVGNLRLMVEAAGPGALALADEIGAGTDPDEGAALGQAVIAALLDRGAHGGGHDTSSGAQGVCRGASGGAQCQCGFRPRHPASDVSLAPGHPGVQQCVGNRGPFGPRRHDRWRRPHADVGPGAGPGEGDWGRANGSGGRGARTGSRRGGA